LLRQQEFIKTQRGKRQLSAWSTATLIRGLRQIYLCKAKYKKKMHPPDRIKNKKLKKEHDTTESQDLQFLLESTKCRC
jgi:hypothetical protein